MDGEAREDRVRVVGSAAVTLGGLVLAFFGVQALASFVGPAFLVVTLVITIQPLRSALRRRNVPEGVSGVIALVSVYGLLLAILGSLVWSLARLAGVLPEYAPAFQALWTDVAARLRAAGITADVVGGWLGAADLSGLTNLVNGALQALTSGASTLAVLLMLVFFLTLDGGGFGDRLAFIEQLRPGVAEALRDFAARVRRYWLVTSAFGLVVALLDTLGLAVLGVPLAVTWGVLAFVTNYIPNVGFFIGLLPPVLIALVDGGPWTAVAVIAVYGVINLVVQTVIQPRITGDAVGLAPSIALLSLLFWTIILGPLGALLAIPATLLLKSLFIDHSDGTLWLRGLFESHHTISRQLRPSGEH